VVAVRPSSPQLLLVAVCARFRSHTSVICAFSQTDASPVLAGLGCCSPPVQACAWSVPCLSRGCFTNSAHIAVRNWVSGCSAALVMKFSQIFFKGASLWFPALISSAPVCVGFSGSRNPGALSPEVLLSAIAAHLPLHLSSSDLCQVLIRWCDRHWVSLPGFSPVASGQ